MSGKSIILNAVGAGAALAGAQVNAADKPNILFILADDMGVGDLGCYGQKKIKTPNLDRMAAEGMKFTRMYSGSALCAPARCSFITGLHAGHGFVRNNFKLNFEGNIPIPADSQTIPKLLQSVGYKTACVGKWGLGYPGSWGDPMNQGFDHFYGFNCQRHAHTYYPTYVWNDKEREQYPPDNSEKTKKVYVHDKFTEQNLKFIEENAGKNPFFIYMAYTIPHVPLTPLDLKPYENTGWPNSCKAYAAMITRLDSDIGKILAKLKELGIAEDTLVLFTSDNGPYGTEIVKFFNSNAGLRGKKGRLFEGGIREPFIAYWPGKIKPGSVSDHPTILWDMLPTFAELAGVAPEKPYDGISIVPTILGTGTQKKHKYLYWELGGMQAVRFGNYKAVRQNNMIMLFNTKDDVNETNDIASSNPEVVDRAEKIMQEAHVPSPLFPLIFLKEKRGKVDIGNNHIIAPASSKRRHGKKTLKE